MCNINDIFKQQKNYVTIRIQIMLFLLKFAVCLPSECDNDVNCGNRSSNSFACQIVNHYRNPGKYLFSISPTCLRPFLYPPSAKEAFISFLKI